MYINQYKAPQSYYNQYQNQDFFNDQYMNYIKQLQNDLAQDQEQEYQQKLAIGSSHSSHSSEYEDREDQSEQTGVQDYNTGSSDSNIDEMINLYTCDFAQFSQHMIKQYGEQ